MSCKILQRSCVTTWHRPRPSGDRCGTLQLRRLLSDWLDVGFRKEFSHQAKAANSQPVQSVYTCFATTHLLAVWTSTSAAILTSMKSQGWAIAVSGPLIDGLRSIDCRAISCTLCGTCPQPVFHLPESSAYFTATPILYLDVSTYPRAAIHILRASSCMASSTAGTAHGAKWTE
jgi:hypothetical protein